MKTSTRRALKVACWTVLGVGVAAGVVATMASLGAFRVTPEMVEAMKKGLERSTR